jgi:ribosomal protein L12E/L44/L45/RPP1/RPP2
MADQNDAQQNDVDTSELDGIDDHEAEQLLADAVEADERERSRGRRAGDDDDPDAEHLGDAGKRALDRMKAARKAAEKEAAELRARLEKYENANKSELQRLQEERDRLRDELPKVASKAKALEIALDAAPPHASLAQVRAVAKRVRGADDDELLADAQELFELLAPAPAEDKPASKVAGARPKPRLKGGTAEPDEEPEETDPRKLAALLPRRR